MTVRFYPAKKGEKSRTIAKFLLAHSVTHELIRPEEADQKSSHLHKGGEVPALEVDGKLFIDPNDEALRRILHVD
jgi:hypothetical protein